MTWQSVGQHTFLPTDRDVQVGSFDLAPGQDTVWVRITQINQPAEWPWSYGILSWRSSSGLELGSTKAYSTQLGEVFRLGVGLPPSDRTGSIWFEPRGFNLGWLKAGFPWELSFEAQAGSSEVNFNPYWFRANSTLSPVNAGDDLDNIGKLNLSCGSTVGSISFSNPANLPSIFLRKDDSVGTLIEISTAAQGSIGFRSTDGSKDRGQITVDTGGRFRVEGRSSNPVVCQSGGQTGTTQSGTDWVPYTSEERLKNKVPSPPDEDDQCWDLVKNLKLHRYYYKTDDQSGVPYYGPMAGELADADPEMVIFTGDSDDIGPIRTYNKPLLEMKALNALSKALTRIEALEAEVAALNATSHKQ